MPQCKIYRQNLKNGQKCTPLRIVTVLERSLIKEISLSKVIFTIFSKNADNTGISFNQEDYVFYPDRKKGKLIAVTGHGSL